jgi:hypothetical protein
LSQLARQSWALFKKECLRYDAKTKELSPVSFTGAGNLDAGNYETGKHAICPHVVYAAAEFDDEKIGLAALKYTDEHVGLETTSTGAQRAKLGSFLCIIWLE